MLWQIIRRNSNKLFKNSSKLLSTKLDSTIQEQVPNLDFNYLCSPVNTPIIKCSMVNRKSTGDLDKVITLHKHLLECDDCEKRRIIERDLINEALKIPNRSHPSLVNNNEPKVLKTMNSPIRTFKPLPFETLVKKLNLTKTGNLANVTGPRSYFLLDGLAQLENALIQYTVDELVKQKFRIISVPDILPRSVIEYCGMDTRGERTQVYELNNMHGTDICLSGTAEMGIAYYLKGKKFNKNELPLKLAAVSRCFRAETSKISVEKGLYRVHQFTKVEMFGVTSEEESDELFNKFLLLQESVFSALGLQLRVLDMPECDLGAQAYRKFDIECYMPGKDYWGELSSTSNCIDYQSRRLDIKYTNDNYTHTINGTACAIPRLLIAILETNQEADETIRIPRVLVPYLGFEVLEKSKIPKLLNLKLK